MQQEARDEEEKFPATQSLRPICGDMVESEAEGLLNCAMEPPRDALEDGDAFLEDGLDVKLVEAREAGAGRGWVRRQRRRRGAVL